MSSIDANHLKNVMFYSRMKTTAYLLEWSPCGLDGHIAISLPFLLAKNSNVPTPGPWVQTFDH